MNKSEIHALLMTELSRQADGIVDALAEFERNPNASTFRAAENIPHKLILQALDVVVGQMAKTAAKNAELDCAVKKTDATMDGGKSASN